MLFHIISLNKSSGTKRALMKRYMMIEKTKDADRIGILVGTLGASRYGAIIVKAFRSFATF